jgi:hypothetical protein
MAFAVGATGAIGRAVGSRVMPAGDPAVHVAVFE